MFNQECAVCRCEGLKLFGGVSVRISSLGSSQGRTAREICIVEVSLCAVDRSPFFESKVQHKIGTQPAAPNKKEEVQPPPLSSSTARS